MLKNTHPSDRLAEVRHQIGELKEEEQRLRRHLIDNPDDRTGDEYVAVIYDWSRPRVDMSGLTAYVGHEIIERFTRPWKGPCVRVRRLSEDEQINDVAI